MFETTRRLRQALEAFWLADQDCRTVRKVRPVPSQDREDARNEAAVRVVFALQAWLRDASLLSDAMAQLLPAKEEEHDTP